MKRLKLEALSLHTPHYYIVDGNVDDFDEKSDETHHEKA